MSRCPSCGSTVLHPIFLHILHRKDCGERKPRPVERKEIRSVSVDGFIIRASKIATEAHRDQVRKYNQTPFVFHPMRVAGRVMLLPDVTPLEIAAAWLHDVLEDTPMKRQDLLDRGMPESVVKYVEALTNPSKDMKDIPRKERKEADLKHLEGQSDWVKKIKMLDRIDNLNELSWEDLDFMEVYCMESRMLVGRIGSADPSLAEELREIVQFYESEIGKILQEKEGHS